MNSNIILIRNAIKGLNMKNVVEISNLYWRFPTFTGIRKEFSLRNINLKIREGEVFGITGSTSSGKTTLCYVIAGLIPQQIKQPKELGKYYFEGKVKILGEVVAEHLEDGDKSPVRFKSLQAGRLGFVRQDPESHFVNGTVMDELKSGLLGLNLTKNEIERRIKWSLETVGLGEIFQVASRVYPSELSTGEKQRVVIASFLAQKPDILILDEPTSDLDPQGKAILIEAIEKLKKEGKITIILVEQDPEIMKRFVDRMAVMHSGEIAMIDTPENVYSNDEVRKYIEIPQVMEILGDGSLLHSRVDPRKVKGFKVEREEPEKGEVMIEARDLNFTYEDGTIALNGINLVVRKREFVALIGQNASGKSTLSKVIAGQLGGWEGSLKVLNRDLKNLSAIEFVRRHVGYVLQNPGQQVANGRVRDQIYSILSKSRVSRRKQYEQMEDVLRKVNLLDKADENVESLSRGEKRRLALARVLVSRPELLIVDEPTAGLDYRMSRELMDLLSDLNGKGVTVIIITHEMRLVAEYTRRAIVMKNGSIVFNGTPESLFSNDEIMKLSSLIPPQAVRVSRQLKESGVINDILLNAKEWLAFFDFEREKKKFIALKFDDLKGLSKRMGEDILSRFGRPSLIVYIERGGMVIARLLSDYLEVKDMVSIKASYYTDDGLPSGSVNISNFNFRKQGNGGYVLLVDDIADTGKTIEAVLEVLKRAIPSKIVIATAIYKPQSIIKPDVYAYTVDNDTWIVFDYEENETFKRFVRKDNRDGLKFMEDNFIFNRRGMKSTNIS